MNIEDIKFEKKFLYDWVGSNEWLFKGINDLSGDSTYNSFMVFLSELGDYHHFHFLMLFLTIFALGEFILRKVMRRAGATQTLVIWIGVLLVMVSSHIGSMLLLDKAKNHFQYPRPYVYLSEPVKVLVPRRDADDDYRSFPSGHATHITVIVTALWPILPVNAMLLGAGLVFGVCWSRIAVGMHFPADVLGGFLLGFFITLLLRWVIYTLLFKLFRMKC